MNVCLEVHCATVTYERTPLPRAISSVGSPLCCPSSWQVAVQKSAHQRQRRQIGSGAQPFSLTTSPLLHFSSNQWTLSPVHSLSLRRYLTRPIRMCHTRALGALISGRGGALPLPVPLVALCSLRPPIGTTSTYKSLYYWYGKVGLIIIYSLLS